MTTYIVKCYDKAGYWRWTRKMDHQEYAAKFIGGSISRATCVEKSDTHETWVIYPYPNASHGECFEIDIIPDTKDPTHDP